MLQLLEQTKVDIMLNKKVVFLSTIMAQTPIAFDDSIPTGATDGKQILLNSNFFKNLDKKEREFLILHEIMHIVLMHAFRQDNKDPVKYNMAGDYVINDYLIEQEYPLIDGGLYDSKYHNLSTEEIYALLDNENTEDFNQDVLYNNSNTDSSDIESIITQATQLAQMTNNYDSIPNCIKRYIEKLQKPKVNWQVVLQRFLQDTIKDDYTWAKPNKRHLTRGYYMPSVQSKSLTKLCFLIDVSMSITDKMFNQFISEIAFIIKRFKPNALDIVLFDYKVQSKTTVKSLSELHRIEFTGGGGTNPSTALQTFNNSDCVACITITDGYFSLNLPKVTKPIIWCIFDNDSFRPPFGKVINYEIN